MLAVEDRSASRSNSVMSEHLSHQRVNTLSPRSSSALCKPLEVIHEEFEGVRAWSKEFQSRQTFTEGQKDDNAPKNRYANVCPYDSTRVRLETIGYARSDYINASYIRMAPSQEPAEYIACQAPLPATMNDYWQMVWENQVKVIVMLTGCTEKGRIKAHPYWPETGKSLLFGRIGVSCALEKTFEMFRIRCLRLTVEGRDGKVKEQRNLYHIQHTEWNDMSCPSSKRGIYQLIKLVDACAKRTDIITESLVVHCSAGIGRAGTFIAIDEAMRQLNKDFRNHSPSSDDHPEQRLDIPSIVRTLRSQRLGMVQTPEQFAYIYQVLQEYSTALRAGTVTAHR